MFRRLALLLALLASRAHAQPSTVGVDLSGLDDATFRRIEGATLETRALARLVQDGFAVVAATAQPAILLTLRGDDSALIIDATAGSASLSRRLTLGSASTAELQLELVQKMSELARELSAAPKPPTPPAAPLPTPPAEAASRLSGSILASAVLRSAVDPSVTLGARWGRPMGWGIAGELAFTPSGGSGITVEEMSATVGAGYRWGLNTSLRLDIGVRAGILSQYYALSDMTALAPRGWEATAVFEAPLELSFWLTQSTALFFRAVPGVAAQGYEHLDSGQVLWARRPLRFEAGVGLQLVFE